MKIYFAGSIRGGRADQIIYADIIALLKQFGTVLTEHFADPELTAEGHGNTVNAIYKQDISWINQSDMLVAEVTQPSLGVGYEICYGSEVRRIPVIGLFRSSAGRSLSA